VTPERASAREEQGPGMRRVGGGADPVEAGRAGPAGRRIAPVREERGGPARRSAGGGARFLSSAALLHLPSDPAALHPPDPAPQVRCCLPALSPCGRHPLCFVCRSCACAAPHHVPPSLPFPCRGPAPPPRRPLVPCAAASVPSCAQPCVQGRWLLLTPPGRWHGRRPSSRRQHSRR
jgi:hypothetical protein